MSTTPEMTGAGHYLHAEALLAQACRRDDDGWFYDRSRPENLTAAFVHATLALAAATALTVTGKFVGDSPEVTEWAHAIQPDAIKPHRYAGFPDHWPPRHGDIWQDNSGDRWSCQQDGSLAGLARKADGAPAEINSVYGPTTLVYRPDATEEGAPF